MIRTRHYAVFLVGVTAVLVGALSPAAASPDLSCSSEGAKGMVRQIFSRAILSDLRPDQQAKLGVSGSVINVRTVSRTDTEHLCRATFTATVSFDGQAPPPPRPKVIHSFAEIDAAADAVMTAAAANDKSQLLIHQTNKYRGVDAEWLKTLPLSTAVYQVLSDGNRYRGTWWDALAQTDAYKALQDAERAENAKDKTDREAQSAFDGIRFAAEKANKKAALLSGEVEYTVEATDDGQAYITVHGRQN